MSLFFAFAIGALATCAATDGFALRSGDRVAFYGDSITEQAHYTNYVEAFVACRMPELRAEFFGVGWAGDTTWGTTGWDLAGGTAQERVEKDVRPLRATVVTVMLGMNDGGYVPYDPKILAVFSEHYEKLIGYLQAAAPKARFTLIRTSPWDDVTRNPSFVQGVQGEGGYNSVLQRYGEKVREIAAKHSFAYVDFNQPMVDAMAKAKKIDLELSHQIVPDWIHPGPAGGLIMAAELLEAWRAPPLVSSVALDASSNQVLEQAQTTVSEFQGLRWVQHDHALPFPVDRKDRAIALAAQCCDLQRRLNRQELRVSGLRPGPYGLRIDGMTVARLSDAELEKGIDLTDYDTPMMRQALEVHRLTVQKNRVFFAQWREVSRPFGNWEPARRAAAAVDRLRKALIAKQREAARTVSHRFEIVPLASRD